uniref:Uncharacterized protein n=1 Tax=Plectus sambesii TaxID=2011161 RepID=A0A914USC0_9BILA
MPAGCDDGDTMCCGAMAQGTGRSASSVRRPPSIRIRRSMSTRPRHPTAPSAAQGFTVGAAKMGSTMPSRVALLKPVEIVGFVVLTITLLGRMADASSSVQGNVVTCYEAENYCKANCTQKCYYVDSCNGSSRGMYACAPNIILIVGIILGVVLLLLLICCITCCCCPCCIFAQCMQRQKAMRQSRAIMPAVEPQPPPGTEHYMHSYPTQHIEQQPPAYIEEELNKV